MRWLVILLAVMLSAAPAMAAEKTALTQGPSATVTRVVDGDTVVLSKKILDAAQIRLVGIQAPKVPLGRKGFPVWPLAEASKKILQAMVLGKVVKLSFSGAKMDHHGRLLAHLLLKGGNRGGRWVQGEMLRLGMARVYTFPDNRAVATEILALKAKARCMFKKMNIPPVSLQSNRVRVRGWLKKFNRPMIEVTHPE